MESGVYPGWTKVFIPCRPARKSKSIFIYPRGVIIGLASMQLPINEFKRAILEGRLQIGLWCSLCSNVVAEVIAGSGFDWILIDTEHAPNELPMVFGQLQALVGSSSSPVIRPAWNDMVLMKRLLDIGVQNFLVPYVQTPEEARAAVAATRYPPQGIRGVAVTHRANQYGRVKDYY